MPMYTQLSIWQLPLLGNTLSNVTIGFSAIQVAWQGLGLDDETPPSAEKDHRLPRVHTANWKAAKSVDTDGLNNEISAKGTCS